MMLLIIKMGNSIVQHIVVISLNKHLKIFLLKFYSLYQTLKTFSNAAIKKKHSGKCKPLDI